MWVAKYRNERPEYKAKAQEQTKSANQKRWRDDAEYRRKKADNNALHAEKRAARRVAQYEQREDIRAAKAAKHAERYANDPGYVARLQRTRREKVLRSQAARAATFLTDTLGIQHVVIDSVDETGNKTFQPTPKPSNIC